MSKPIAFYDVEVFKYDCLMVVKDINNVEITHIWSDPVPEEDLSSGADWHLFGHADEVTDIVQKYRLCGYNNYGYDDWIITAMMNSAYSVEFIKRENDRIVHDEPTSITRVSRLIDSIDAMQQIDVSHPSLKQIEGNMGRSIIESSVPFDIDRPLTQAERDEVLRYCRYDVENTIEIYKQRKSSYFDTKEALIAALPESDRKRAQRWNTTTISARVLLDEPLQMWRKYHPILKQYWRKPEFDYIPPTVWDMWENAEKDTNVMGKGVSKTITAFGCKVVMGLGGLHGAPAKPGTYHNVKLADVGSMYPSIIVILNALNEATAKYDGIRQERLKIKKSDPVKAGALKLILNSVYGNLKNEHSMLFNPRASSSISIYGQIALMRLCNALDKAGYRIVNINTDGVAFEDTTKSTRPYQEICREWEEYFKGMLLEVDEFDKWIQKDVNNYIATHGDHIKVKGGEVNKYAQDKLFSNNSCRVVHMAMVDVLVNDRKPSDALFDILNGKERPNDPMWWQYILKAGSTFQGVQNREGEWMNKVNRVFAGNPLTIATTKLYKIRADGGQVNFADSPEAMYVWNDDTHSVDDFDMMIDVSHYLKILETKLKGWPERR